MSDTPIPGHSLPQALRNPANRAGLSNADYAEVVCSYVSPTPRMTEAHKAIAVAARVMMIAILESVPAGADQSAALRLVGEAKMTASRGVALEGFL